MADWGIKISQQGNDVSGPDQRLLFSSSWPVLPISDQDTIPTIPPGQTIVTHDLGYVPMFWVFTNDKYSTANNTGVASFNHGFRGRVLADSTTLKTYSAGSNDFTGRYLIFAIDIEQPYTAPTVNLTTPDDELTGSRDWGIRIAKEGKSITSTDLRDYTIHSGSRTPMIHSITPGSKAASPNDVSVTHGLGYEPMYFVYAKLASVPEGYQIVGNATDSRVTVTDTTLSLYLPYEADYSIVILKDPLLGV